ncbi:MurR/RpiR family transcriptional regulator [Fundicoccus culcitae]|uniref:MurR/RpiR family transcriptional regulator n=1 Tax=Fundicoccus culcitae TaxID=2969821 RepID=A0ABY5P3G7_9LACT|nr:MurR/RpiR family transcriptional regulator [Fundicoccus culcitae]UUX33151.1 MurR/RpiR family transcriptional regulator [Fundicoccus culcitae]
MSFFGNIDFNELTETERYIYDFMTSNSNKIPYMRVREIADESHTSASSVMRFIRKLGYESFTDFRSHYQTSKVELNDLLDGLNILNKDNFPTDLAAKLRQVAVIIRDCENLVFVGIGSSGAICEYAARRFALLGYNTYPMTDPTYPIFAKLRNTSNNVAIMLSVSGATTELLELANGFKNKRDFTTVAITGAAESTLAKMSEHVLSYRVERRTLHRYEDITSQIPSIFLIESLSEAVLQFEEPQPE